MSGPEFDDITGEETSSNDSKDSSPDKRGFKQVHIKGRFGTHTYDNTTDCVVCRRKPAAVLLVGVDPVSDYDDHDSVRHVCEDHEGDVRGDLEYHPEQVKRVDFQQES